MQNVPDRLTNYEQQAADVGVTMRAICEAAELEYSTYWRWREGRVRPSWDAWERFIQAYERLTTVR